MKNIFAESCFNSSKILQTFLVKQVLLIETRLKNSHEIEYPAKTTLHSTYI